MGMRTASDLQSYTEMEKLRQKFKSQIALISINKRFYCARIIVKKITKGKKTEVTVCETQLRQLGCFT